MLDYQSVADRITAWPLEVLEEERQRTRARIERDQLWVVQLNCAITQKQETAGVVDGS